MEFIFRCVAVLLLLCLLGLSGCSKGKETADGKKKEKTVSEQAAEAIREYAKEPMDRARATQQLGEERTEAIDQALKQ